MADIKLFAVQNNLGIPLQFVNTESASDNATLPPGRGYTYGNRNDGCDVPECDNSGQWSAHHMTLESSDGSFALNLFKQGAALYYSLGSGYPSALTPVPGTPDTRGNKNLLTISGSTSAPSLAVQPLPPSYYRLELWFDWDDPNAKVSWGVTRADSEGSTTPSVVGKANGNVQLYDASVSELDIAVFDASANADPRTLENIELDFENVTAGSNNNPIGDASSLRSGMSGSAFSSGPQPGLTIYSYPGGPHPSNCGWESKQSYQRLTDGDYTFTGTLRVVSGTLQKQFSIDPEMDISG